MIRYSLSWLRYLLAGNKYFILFKISSRRQQTHSSSFSLMLYVLPGKNLVEFLKINNFYPSSFFDHFRLCSFCDHFYPFSFCAGIPHKPTQVLWSSTGKPFVNLQIETESCLSQSIQIGKVKRVNFVVQSTGKFIYMRWNIFQRKP